jgi:hypothetical protein
MVPRPEFHFLRLYDQQNSPLRGAALQEALNPEIWSIRRKLEAARKSCTHIYLAAAKLEALRAHREELKKLLHQERLTVLPGEAVNARTPSNRMLKWLGDSELSVHYDVPDDPLHAVQIQAAKDAGKLVVPIKPAQPIREIADRISSELRNLQRRRQLYLIYDPSTDGDQIAPLTNYFSHGYQVVEPQPGEKYHQDRLAKSDGVLFFHRDAPASWVSEQRVSLRQGAALRKQPRPEALYFVRPGAPSDVIVTRDPQLPQWTITRTGDLNLTDLQPFAEAMENWSTATA